MTRPLPAGRRHLAELDAPLRALHRQAPQVERWGRRLAEVLLGGGRLLAAGNGGSAAQAQHLTAELVGRYRDDRPPFSAIPLCAEGSAMTAIGNDYGIEEIFARQVRAHGRPGDVLVALSTSGRSPNVLAAVDAAGEQGMACWALTGRLPNPLAERADECARGRFPAHRDGAGGPPDLRAPAVRRGRRGAGPHGREGGGVTRLVVIGDALLDRDLDGRAERLAPDAPVPVVDGMERRDRAGGAGLAATLAAAAGHAVTLVCALGDDAPGARVRELLEQAGVEVCDLGLPGATPEKVRVRVGGRALVRLDSGGEARGCGPLDGGRPGGARVRRRRARLRLRARGRRRALRARGARRRGRRPDRLGSPRPRARAGAGLHAGDPERRGGPRRGARPLGRRRRDARPRGGCAASGDGGAGSRARRALPQDEARGRALRDAGARSPCA